MRENRVGIEDNIDVLERERGKMKRREVEELEEWKRVLRKRQNGMENWKRRKSENPLGRMEEN